jgi:hypothetical protein
MAMQEGPVKWEQMVVKYETKDPRFINEALKTQGEDGFELILIVGDLYYFKRQKPE